MGTRRASVVALLALVLVSMAALPEARADHYEVHPAIDVTDFVLFSVKESNTTQIFPTGFRIEYRAEWDICTCWWWNPFDDPSNYRYRVASKSYRFLVDPPQVLELGDGTRVLLTWFSSLSAVAYATKTWYGAIEERVKVVLTVYAYGKIDNVSYEPRTIDLGQLIAQNISSDRIYVAFNVTVEKLSPSHDYVPVSGTFDLLLDDLVLHLHRLRVDQSWIDSKGYRVVGRYNDEGYIMVAPVGDIHVTLCLDSPAGSTYRLSGTLRYRNPYACVQTKVSISSGECRVGTLKDVPLVPGNYRDNGSLVVSFITGLGTFTLPIRTEVAGVFGVVSKPTVLLVYEDRGNGTYDWRARLVMGVEVKKYPEYLPGAVVVGARMVLRIGNVTRTIDCGEQSFVESGSYSCSAFLDLFNESIKSAVADVAVAVRLGNVEVEDNVTVDCIVVTSSNVHGLLYAMYNTARWMLSGVALALIIILVANHFLAACSRPIVDPYHVVESLIAVLALNALLNVVPYFHVAIYAGLYSSLPEIQSILARSPVSNPQQLASLPPDAALALLMSYYDLTLTGLRIDYHTWFVDVLQVSLAVRFVLLGALVAMFLAIAIVAMATMNSPAGGAVVLPLVSFMASLVGMLILMFPTVGVVQALIALAEFFVAVCSAVFLAFFMLGALLLVVPHPTARAYAEFLVGAGLFYLMVIPSTGVVSYVMYMYVKQTLENYIANTVLSNIVAIFATEIFVPVVEMMRMVGYLLMATAIPMTIILTHAFLLSRTGIMVGLGEGLVRTLRRFT